MKALASPDRADEPSLAAGTAAWTPGEDDPRVIEALEAYLALRESGAAVDREVFLAERSGMALPLRRLIEGVELLMEPAELAASWRPGLASTDGAGRPTGRNAALGDFQIVREVGRGGMGVVYEAVQTSSQLRVALKVLPPGAWLDRRQCLRFEHEAQMAARLDHPNIVPVLAIGREHGLPFYAMRYVDGANLGEMIGWRRGEAPAEDRARRTAWPEVPEPRTAAYHAWVARIGRQACEALDHAHRRGVVHRDIKPANLLVESDGRLWITDFGLARFRGELGMTASGDVVGTLRYMSPEQALGRNTGLDGRSDIYSLGATLYELLTLEPVLEGRDVAEILSRIANQSPVPPRSHDPRVPRALETIVLKAMAKEPEHRYRSAQEMAADLERFGRHEPIVARRPRLPELAGAWAKRHRRTVTTAVVVLIGLVGLLAGGTWFLWNESQTTREALRAESAERSRAEANVELAMEALDSITLREAERQVRELAAPLSGESDFHLRRALEFYDRFVTQNGDHPGVVRLSAEAYTRVADLRAELGEVEAAEQSYRRAIELLRQLSVEHPEVMRYRFDLAMAQNNLGVVLRDGGRSSEAVEAFRGALGLLGPLTAGMPTAFLNERRLAVVEHNLGVLLSMNARIDEAEPMLRSALERRRHLLDQAPQVADLRNDLALTYASLGGIQRKQKQLVEADASFEAAVSLLTHLASSQPDNAEYQRNLARNLYNQALMRSESGLGVLAEPLIVRATKLQRDLIERFPNRLELVDDLALSACALGHVRASLADPDRAVAAFSEAVSHWERLAKERPGVPSYASRALGAHLELAFLHRDFGRTEEAIAEFRLVLAAQPENPIILNDLAWALGSEPGASPTARSEAVSLAKQAIAIRGDLAPLWNTLGVVLYHDGRYDEARAAIEQSIELNGGGDGFDWLYLARLAHQRQDRSAAHDCYARARRWLEAQSGSDPEVQSLHRAVAVELAVEPPPQAGPEPRGTGGGASCRSGRGIGPTSITAQTLQRVPATRTLGI